MRGATRYGITGLSIFSLISIHAPHARSDAIAGELYGGCCDFNPRSSCEERRAILSEVVPVAEFQSTLLMRGATHEQDKNFGKLAISIHAPHARSDDLQYLGTDESKISIHAPHARSDAIALSSSVLSRYFNPRSSCEERQPNKDAPMTPAAFQSTLLMRGATSTIARVLQVFFYFNPRSSCEERPHIYH